jgi:hypothetical protein
MVLLGFFAGVALLLSSIEIYGVVSYVVAQSIQEIGTSVPAGIQTSAAIRRMDFRPPLVRILLGQPHRGGAGTRTFVRGDDKDG